MAQALPPPVMGIRCGRIVSVRAIFVYNYLSFTELTHDQLLALAMDHLDTGVQIEAAWAAAKLGRDAGLKMLARYCRDVNHSAPQRRQLRRFCE